MTRRVKPKLFVFDMDGTALGGHEPYEQFPRPFAKFLDELTERGIRWSTNTTWSPDMIHKVAQRSAVKSRPACLTGQTGRLLATVRNGRAVADKKHEESILRREARFKARHWPTIRKLFMALLRDNLVDRLSFGFWNQNMVTFSCKKRHAKRVWRVLHPLLASGHYYTFNGREEGATGWLIPVFMNKGEIMKTLQKRFKLGPENIIVAGDAMNDWQMFDPTLARWMVCPANADPRIKEKVLGHGGVVGTKKYSWGVIEATRKILAQLG